MTLLRLFIALLLLCLCPLSACAEVPLYPELSDPVDQYMQSLYVMSQRDSAFEGVPYNNGLLTIRGCGPVSIANAVIASFGVTDRDTAIGIVLETADLLVHKPMRKKAPAELTFVSNLLDPERRSQEKDSFPHMAALLDSYPGSITLFDKTLSAEKTIGLIASQQPPAKLVSTVFVHPEWTDVVQILYTLHDAGHDDAALCLAYGGAGTAASGAPLRTGEYGHYVTLMIHVGSFVSSGTIYLLDSLPRAVKEEAHGYENIYRLRYAFDDEPSFSTFKNQFDYERISPTILRLHLNAGPLSQLQASAQDDRPALHAKLLRPLMLFGRCLMIISLP